MQRAIEETDRRRRRQLEFNAVHGITPRGIQKAVTDIMEGARAEGSAAPGRRAGRGGGPREGELKPEALARQIKRLEAEMLRKARNLEFEEAARLRDEIEQLKQRELGFPRPAMQA
jgi:excinuclease ABC subunit B